jgi:hypothetical protein
VKLVRLRRPKAICFPSYEEYRPNANAAILWDKGHTNRRPHMGWIVQKKEINNLNEVDVLTVQE